MIFLAVVLELPSEQSHGSCSPLCKLLLFASKHQTSYLNEMEIARLEPCLTCSFLPNVLLFLEFYPRESRLTAVETFHSQRLPPHVLDIHQNGVERETFQPNLTAAGVVGEGQKETYSIHAYGVVFITCVWYEV